MNLVYETFLGAAFSSIITTLRFNSQIWRFVVGWELGIRRVISWNATVITATNSFCSLSYNNSVAFFSSSVIKALTYNSVLCL